MKGLALKIRVYSKLPPPPLPQMAHPLHRLFRDPVAFLRTQGNNRCFLGILPLPLPLPPQF